ncbi:hypothetical protein [Halomarina halobia]
MTSVLLAGLAVRPGIGEASYAEATGDVIVLVAVAIRAACVALG